MTNTFTEIRAAVDWANKGVACVGVDLDDPHNLITNGIYYQSHPTYTPSGTLTKTYLPASEYPLAGAVKWNWVTPQSSETWFFRDSGTTRSLTVSPSTEYTMIPYIIPNNFFGSGTFIFRIMGWNGTTWDEIINDGDILQQGQSDLRFRGAGNHFQSRQIPFTTGASHTRLAVKVTSAAFGGGNQTFQIYGFMLVAGTHIATIGGGPKNFNWNCYADDPTCLHDNVTDFLMSADYSIGKTEWDQALPQEGTATLVLRNDTKKFSPERTEFIGGFVTNRRVIIERVINLSGTYTLPDLTWSGWVKSLEPKTNIYGERTATLEALQGWYNIEKVPVTPLILNNVTTGQAMFQALRNGYELPTNPAFAKVGYGLVNNTWLVDPAVLIPNYASGITLDFAGMYWNDNANALQVLEDLIDFENNWTWMNKYGAIHFIPAATITAASAATSLVDSDIQELEYQYGDEIWTGIYTEFLWQTLTPAIEANRFVLSDVVEVDIPANTSMNIVTPHTYNNDNSPNDRSYGTHGDQIATAVRLDDLSTSVTIGGAGNSVVLGFIGTTYDSRSPVTYGYETVYWANNTNAFPVKVSIQTLGYGWRIDADSYVTYNSDTLSNRFGFSVRELQNQYLQSSTLTNDYLGRKIMRFANVYGWFPVAKIIPDNATISGYVNNLSVGNVWEITSEPQTIGSTKTMVVIGENTRWLPQHLEKTIYSSPKF